MAQTAQKLVIRNIGLMLSGNIDSPIIEADCLIAIDGKISAFGKGVDLDTDGATTVVDAHGVTLAPGLIDSHIHPVVGDYTPRQQQLHWIDSTL
ncbi:MAG: Enamidase, partial [Pseudomonadota bacterium]